MSATIICLTLAERGKGREFWTALFREYLPALGSFQPLWTKVYCSSPSYDEEVRIIAEYPSPEICSKALAHPKAVAAQRRLLELSPLTHIQSITLWEVTEEKLGQSGLL